MNGLIQFDSHFLNDADGRSALKNEVDALFGRAASVLILIVALYGIDVWDLSRHLPERFESGFDRLGRPISYLVAIGYLIQGIDKACLRNGQEHATGPARGLLLVGSFLLRAIEAVALCVLAVVVWDVGVALAGRHTWPTSPLLDWKFRDAYLTLTVHLLLVARVALLFAASSPLISMLVGLLLLPAGFMASTVRIAIDGGVLHLERLLEIPGIGSLAGRLGGADHEADVLFASGLVHLGFVGILLALVGLAFWMFRARTASLRTLADLQGRQSPQAPDDAYTSRTGFANRYRVVDLATYEYCTARI